MYPTLLLLVSEHYGASLPTEVVVRIIKASRPCLPFKDELFKITGNPRWIKCYTKRAATGTVLGRILSMERAIQIAVLEMGLPCCPMYWYTHEDDPDALIPSEEAIASPHLIEYTKECTMTPEQRYSQASYDLKVLTIEYMRKLVETPQYVCMGNLINFDGTWIKCRRWTPRSPFGYHRHRRSYLVDGFRAELDKTERENMYPSLYGPLPMQCRVKTRW